MAVAGTAATLLASSLTVISIKSLVTISFSHCSYIAQSDVAGVRLQVHEEQQDPVPAPGRGQVHLRPVKT